MNKILALIMTLFLTQTSILSNEIDDLFGSGEDQEFEFQRLDDNTVMLAIAREAEIACSDGLCTLSAVTEDFNEFSVTFSVGEGNVGTSGYGNHSDSNGTIINVGDGGNSGDRDFWGVSVRYRVGNCTQQVRVPRSLYIAMNRYMYGLLNDDTSTRRGFTPADEAMILFYTTIMKQASGCSSN